MTKKESGEFPKIMTMSEDKKFSYTYVTATEKERREVLRIQQQYQTKQKNSEDKIVKLKVLDKKVKLPAKVVAASMGILGFCCLGLGMTMVLEWGILLWGSLIGIVGIALMSFAYWTHNKILAARKKKYADEILALSENILKESEVNMDIAEIKESKEKCESSDDDNQTVDD